MLLSLTPMHASGHRLRKAMIPVAVICTATVTRTNPIRRSMAISPRALTKRLRVLEASKMLLEASQATTMANSHELHADG
jgi:DNA-binding HxlR family transcriptional regulator